MGKRTKWLAATLVLTAVLAIGVGATVASAATPPSNQGTQTYCGLGGGFRFGGNMVDEVAKVLGMTSDQIRDLRQDGESLVQIAATKNVKEQELVGAIMALKKAEVQDRVAAGTITQDQADLMLQRMQENTSQAVNRTSTGPFGGKGNGRANRSAGDCTGQGRGGRWAQ
jgi:Spy/CpxP family protein refolding chaperone